MNIQELEVLSEIVNYRTFTAAAACLSYSPSVISSYISNIEKELGLKLFVRGNKAHSFELTPEGKVLINAVRRINTDYQSMMEIVRQLKETHENFIRIGSQPRYGNVHEQEIIASFLLNNQDASINRVKMNARDLTSLMDAGRLDALFVSIHFELKVEEYFRELLVNPDFDIIYISSETDLYFGISSEYFPGRFEVTFKELRDFTFAVSFANSSDIQDQKALSTYELLAKENGFALKIMNVGGHDNTAFKLATMMPLAVGTTNKPVHYEGIKFVRLSDWIGCTNLYFVYNKSNHNKMLRNLKSCVLEYIESSGAKRPLATASPAFTDA